MITKFSFCLVLAALLAAGCSRQKYAQYNTNPDNVLVIDPVTEFASAVIQGYGRSSNEAFYDYYRAINNWTLSFVVTGGNSIAFMQQANNIGGRYSLFYNTIGSSLIDVQHSIDIMPDAQKAKYVNIRAIAGIPLAQYALYVTDVYGSIPYTNAFKARYTNPPLLTPAFDNQATIFDTLDGQLKNSVTILEASHAVTQVQLGSSDPYFSGKGDEATNWIMAANSLRLKIAERLMKRSPDKAKAIVTDVLSDKVGPIASRNAQWVIRTSTDALAAQQSIGSGNWDPSSLGESGQKDAVDFMWNKKDPRIRNFYQVSAVTKDMFDSAQHQNVIPATETWQSYRGRYASPDAAKDPARVFYVNKINFSYNGKATSAAYSSEIQDGLFYAAYKSLSGVQNYPVITYADICFMRAEFALKGWTGDNAATWYNNGIDASLADYDQWGSDAKVIGYTALTPAEATQYKAQPGIVFDPSNAAEQIAIQQYFNFYLNQNECWAAIKRTGFPSPAGVIMPIETITVNGAVQIMPRRYPVTPPQITNLNYTNITAALKDMAKDPSYGDGSTDITGRVWWDMK